MSQTIPLFIIRSFSLYTQQWYMSYRFADSLRAGSGRSVLYNEKLLMMDRKNCPKHVQFYSKNKFEKLVHLVGFIIRIGYAGNIKQGWRLITSYMWRWEIFWYDCLFQDIPPNEAVLILSLLSRNWISFRAFKTIASWLVSVAFINQRTNLELEYENFFWWESKG